MICMKVGCTIAKVPNPLIAHRSRCSTSDGERGLHRENSFVIVTSPSGVCAKRSISEKLCRARTGHLAKHQHQSTNQSVLHTKWIYIKLPLICTMKAVRDRFKVAGLEKKMLESKWNERNKALRARVQHRLTRVKVGCGRRHVCSPKNRC